MKKSWIHSIPLFIMIAVLAAVWVFLNSWDLRYRAEDTVVVDMIGETGEDGPIADDTSERVRILSPRFAADALGSILVLLSVIVFVTAIGYR